MPRIANPLVAGLAAAGLALAAGAASAAPIVTVAVGEPLAKNTKSYGARDVELIRSRLQKRVEQAYAKQGAAQPQRVDLVLEKAVPNRPTFEQLSRTPGLSLSSIGLGGARVSGQVTEADGTIKPVKFQWFENNFQQLWAAGIWSDAERAFDRLSSQLAKGKVPEKFGPGGGGDGRFGSFNRFD